MIDNCDIQKYCFVGNYGASLLCKHIKKGNCEIYDKIIQKLEFIPDITTIDFDEFKLKIEVILKNFKKIGEKPTCLTYEKINGLDEIMAE